MATSSETVKGPKRDQRVTEAELLDREGVAIEAGELPIEGDADGSSMLSRLALSMMGCRPELSLATKKMATINGKQQEIEAGETVHQATIFGYLTGLTGPKELPNAKSEAEKYTFGLKGKIEAVNILTGEIFKAAVLYLPSGFHDMFLQEMEQGLTNGSGVEIAFALEFYSIPASNPRGYSWKAVNKMPLEKKDPLARLRQRALAGTTIKALLSNGTDQKLISA